MDETDENVSVEGSRKNRSTKFMMIHEEPRKMPPKATKKTNSLMQRSDSFRQISATKLNTVNATKKKVNPASKKTLSTISPLTS